MGDPPRGDGHIADLADAPLPVQWFVHKVDAFTAWTGRVVSWLTMPLIFAVVYEVILRYFFGNPTIWAYDLSYMLYGAIFMLGAAYTFLHKGHIRTDLFYQNWSPRTQAIVDTVFYFFIFFPGLVFFGWAGWQKTVHSWEIMERGGLSPWRPILYPYRAIIPVTVVLLLFQGISEFIKAVYAIVRDRWP